MAIRGKEKQINFRLSEKDERRFKLALKARDETAQQLLEKFVLEYINANLDTIQKYTEYLQSIAQD